MFPHNKYNEIPVKAIESSTSYNGVTLWQVKSVGMSKEEAIKLQKLINGMLALTRSL